METSLEKNRTKRFSSIFSLLEFQAQTHGDSVAIESASGDPIDFKTLHQRVLSLAQGLRARGAVNDSRYAIVLPNGPDMAVALLGVTCAAVAAPLNPACTEQEFEDYLSQLEVDGVVLGKGVDSPVRSAASRCGVPLLELTLGFPNGPVFDGGSAGGEFAPAGGDDVALVLLTSGSTGASKRVPLTHTNVCASIPEICESVQLGPQDRCLSMWEQFHVGGLVDLLLAPLSVGGTVICGTKFDVELFFRLLKTTRPTWFQAVPAALHEVVAHARRAGLDTVDCSLRLIRSVAAALPPEVMAQVETLFGVPVLQTFGMTEASPLITSTALPPAERKAGSVGHSFGTEVAVMDDDGSLLPTGEIGEVVVRGPNIMHGYENDPEATANCFRNGWFRTGDLGCFDEDGDLFLKGRIREMINRGGEKISPPELDEILAAHPDILQAATFSVPHRVLGEDVAVAVVLRESGACSAEKIREYLSSRVSSFKIPQQIEFVEELPRGATGKVSRRMLTEQYGTIKEEAYVAPRTDLERTLANVWASALQLDRVGVDDNFFRLGGDSLSGVHLMTAVEKQLGRELPVEALIKLNTIRSMAEAISAADASDSPVDLHGLTHEMYRATLGALGASGAPVVSPDIMMLRLHASGSKTPVFWCFNQPLQFEKLSAELGEDQPLYGLFSGGRLVDYNEEMHEKFAAAYTQMIQSVLPEGPFYLGGSCRGGSVMGRVARNLAAAGRTPDGLCVIDYFEPYLFDYPGKMLFLYGRNSHRRAFCAMREFKCAHSGWRDAFANPPEVDWVSGRHARIFGPRYIGILRDRLELFFANQKPRHSSLRRTCDGAMQYIFGSRILFPILRVFFSLYRRIDERILNR